MVKAHEGVPVSDLPGYQPISIVPQQRPNDLLVQRPTAPIGNSSAASLEQEVLDNSVTASNPRPKVGVGENGASNGKSRSLVDIILGR